MADWERVPGHTPLAEAAAVKAGRLAIARGGLADAERVVEGALPRAKHQGFALRQCLRALYWREGRLDDVERLIEADWRLAVRDRNTRLAVDFLRARLALGLDPYPAEAVKAALDEAATQAPDDDRVWLGQAYLAIRTGRLEEADAGSEPASTPA